MNMVLVFTRTKHGADRVARKLEQTGVKCATLHANRSQNQRLKALADFKSGEVRVLVATDIAARGIDVDGISHVVNYDFPLHAEDYVHRIGRTGRAQAIGDAISFISPEDLPPLRALEKFIGRGLVRKRAEGFNYSASAPPRSEEPPRFRDSRAAQFGHVGRRVPGQGGGGRGQGGGQSGRSQGGAPNREGQGQERNNRGPAQGGNSSGGNSRRDDSRPQNAPRGPRPASSADSSQGQSADTAKRSLWRRLSGR
jgi:ATP-dependent RNA helicase RhlE